MTFAVPTVNDHLNQVRLALERGRKRAQEEIARIQSQFAKAGSSGGSRMYVYFGEALTAEFDRTVREALGELRRSLNAIKSENPKVLRDLTVGELENFARQQTSWARDLCSRLHHPSVQATAEKLLMPKAELLGQQLSIMVRQFDVGFLDKAEPEAVIVTNNNLNVGNNVGAIQQGSHGSTQSVSITLDVGRITVALNAFEKELASATVTPEARAALDADIATVHAQMKKPSLSHSILRETGRSIRNVVEGLAAGIMTPQAIAAATALATALGVQ